MSQACFVPHNECSVASGDCFVVGKCLGNCRPRLPTASANEALGTALRLLRELTDFTVASRSCTKYMDGSSIDINVKQARALLEQINGTKTFAAKENYR